MSGFGDGPRFRGDLSDHLPPRAEAPPGRWGDRLRHAWPVYLVVALFAAIWLGAMLVAVMVLGAGMVPGGMMIVFAPAPFYVRFLMLRHAAARDPDTGARLPSREK